MVNIHTDSTLYYCIFTKTRERRKSAKLNRLFAMRLHIFLMYIFYKKCNCYKGFYVFLKYRVYVVLFWSVA